MAQQDHAALTPRSTLRINGSDLPPEVHAEVTQITVDESLDSAGTFALELSNWDQERQEVKWSDDALFQPGGVLEIQLGYEETRVEPVMAGEITGLEVNFEQGRAMLTVRGYDRLHRVRRGRRTRSY